MTKEEFELIIKKLNQRLSSLRNVKGDEYAPGSDRLQNFKTAAEMNHETVPSAIWGMLSKHIVSLADMIRMEYRSRKGRVEFSEKEWEAKLFDAIIYLQLLYAALKEDKE
jgi:hypothetical protein